MAAELRKISFDCYPSLGHIHSKAYSSAIAEVVVDIATFKGAKPFDEQIRAGLKAEGWVAASKISDMSISLDDLRARGLWRSGADTVADGGEYFIQMVAIEYIDRGADNVVFDPRVALRAFVSRAKSQGALLSGYSEHHGHYATGVLDSGEEFVPFWVDRDEADDWMPDFPTFSVIEISIEKFSAWMASAVDADGALAAVGHAGVLRTVHPLQLKDMLTSDSTAA